MTNPVNEAKQLLYELGYNSPCEMTMEEIAWSNGLIVKRGEMDGCEGRILMNNNSGIITINSKISYQPKINYILAHEIGHARLHKNIPLFADTDQTLNEWYAKGAHETEANQFAAELLMPTELFSKMVKQKKLSLQLIEEAASYFGASKTATFLRYRDLGDFPVMIIFIEHGLIKWKTSSNDFPFKWLPFGSKVPAWTVAGDFYYKGVKEEQPVKIDAIEWFPEDYKLLRGNEKQKLWEQCFPATKEGILTCLWTI